RTLPLCSSFSFTLRPPPRSTLFPYTTLFRSSLSLIPSMLIFLIASNFITKSIEGWFKPQVERPLDQALAVAQTYYANLERLVQRSEEHTSELQSLTNLVCRLLLEKKKKTTRH